MERITKHTLNCLVLSINVFYGEEKFFLAYRNGFTYFQERATNNTHFDSATTNKEMYLCLRSYLTGLQDAKNLIKNL